MHPLTLVKAQGKSGWMMLAVQETKSLFLNATTEDLEPTTVSMSRMQASLVTVSVYTVEIQCFR